MEHDEQIFRMNSQLAVGVADLLEKEYHLLKLIEQSEMQIEAHRKDLASVREQMAMQRGALMVTRQLLEDETSEENDAESDDS